MDREEAYKINSGNPFREDTQSFDDWNKGVVDAIYDDFEKQVCENCEHSTIEGEDLISCELLLIEAYFSFNFGCNKWLKKNGNKFSPKE